MPVEVAAKVVSGVTAIALAVLTYWLKTRGRNRSEKRSTLQVTVTHSQSLDESGRIRLAGTFQDLPSAEAIYILLRSANRSEYWGCAQATVYRPTRTWNATIQLDGDSVIEVATVGPSGQILFEFFLREATDGEPHSITELPADVRLHHSVPVALIQNRTTDTSDPTNDQLLIKPSDVEEPSAVDLFMPLRSHEEFAKRKTKPGTGSPGKRTRSLRPNPAPSTRPDREVFAIVFGSFSLSPTADAVFLRIEALFKRYELGPFEARKKLLIFLKAKLDGRPRDVVSLPDDRTLAAWVREYDRARQRK